MFQLTLVTEQVLEEWFTSTGYHIVDYFGL